MLLFLLYLHIVDVEDVSLSAELNVNYKTALHLDIDVHQLRSNNLNKKHLRSKDFNILYITGSCPARTLAQQRRECPC